MRLIFDLYVNQGMGSTRIAGYLNSIGCKSFTGKQWERSAITAIIKNQVYVGKVTWKKKCIRKATAPNKSKDSYTRPKDEWIVANGKHAALVEESLFNKAQEILSCRYHAPYPVANGLQNPLAGLVICRQCGAKMKKRPYRHGGPHIICENCSNKSSRFHYVEKRILQLLEEWLQDYEVQLTPDKPERKDVDAQVRLYRKNLAGMEKELEELKAQKLRLHNLLEQGIYDAPTFLERSGYITERLDTLMEQIGNVKTAIERSADRKLSQTHVVPRIKSLLDLYWKTDNNVEKNELLKCVLDKVEYWKDKSQKDDHFFIAIYPKILA